MNKTKLPSIVPLLILTLITVVMWVSLDVYRVFVKPPDIIVPAEISQPLTPTLDQAVINQIEGRSLLDSSQIPDNVIKSVSVLDQIATPSSIIVPTPTPVPSNQPINASGSAATTP